MSRLSSLIKYGFEDRILYCYNETVINAELYNIIRFKEMSITGIQVDYSNFILLYQNPKTRKLASLMYG